MVKMIVFNKMFKIKLLKQLTMHLLINAIFIGIIKRILTYRDKIIRN